MVTQFAHTLRLKKESEFFAGNSSYFRLLRDYAVAMQVAAEHGFQQDALDDSCNYFSNRAAKNSNPILTKYLEQNLIHLNRRFWTH